MWKVTHLTHLSNPYTAVRISSQTRQRLLWEVTRFKHYSKPSEISIPQGPLDARQRLLWKVTHFEHYSKTHREFQYSSGYQLSDQLADHMPCFSNEPVKDRELVSEFVEPPIDLQTQTSSDRELFRARWIPDWATNANFEWSEALFRARWAPDWPTNANF